MNGCRPKVKHNLLQSDKTEGGLPLVNLHKRDAAIKIGWVTRLHQEDHSLGVHPHPACCVLRVACCV